MKNRTEFKLEEAGDPSKLLVNVAKFQDKTDVIRRLAIDARQLK